MKLIIAGSRTVKATVEELDALIAHYGLQPSVIISGTAQGMDLCGEFWAKAHEIEIERFPADWENLGRKAGHIRNKHMADVGDALLLVWDGISAGSSSMKKYMHEQGKPVFEAIVKSTIEEKVDYVKSQGQTRKHHCHWPDCNKNVPPAMWGCREHWYKLPKYLRDRIWATYRPGQEVNATPSKSYVTVARQVQDWIKENHGK